MILSLYTNYSLSREIATLDPFFFKVIIITCFSNNDKNNADKDSDIVHISFFQSFGAALNRNDCLKT